MTNFESYFSKCAEMSKKRRNPLVFFDLSVDGDPVEKIVMEVIQISKTKMLFTLYFTFSTIF